MTYNIYSHSHRFRFLERLIIDLPFLCLVSGDIVSSNEPNQVCKKYLAVLHARSKIGNDKDKVLSLYNESILAVPQLSADNRTCDIC